MSIIGFLGKARAGKDTAADYLVKNHGYIKMSFAHPLKEICRTLFGFTDDQLYGNKKEELDSNWGVTPRRTLQFIGTDMFRNNIEKLFPDIGNNFWAHCVKVKYEQELKNNPNFKCVISDVRFQNEIDMINSLQGDVIKVQRDVADNIESQYTLHESEINIDNLVGYKEISNNSTIIDLHSKINNILKL